MDQASMELCQLLERYYSQNASNEERKTAEKQLVDLVEKDNMWMVCINLLLTSNNPQINIVCYESLKCTIRRHWHVLSFQDKNIFKTYILNLTFRRDYVTDAAKTRYLCHLLAMLGRVGYPDEFPEFFKVIETGLNDLKTRVIAAQVLYSTFEEFLGLKSAILSSRRHVLKTALLEYCLLSFQNLFIQLNLIYKRTFSAVGSIRSNSFTHDQKSQPLFNSPQTLFIENNARSISPHVVLSSGDRLRNEPTPEDADSVVDKESCEFVELIMNSYSCFLHNFQNNAFSNIQIVNVLTLFASSPYSGSPVSEEKIRLAGVAFQVLIEVVSLPSFFARYPDTLPLMMDWSFQLLSKMQSPLQKFPELDARIATFFHFFIVIFCKKYFYSPDIPWLKYMSLFLGMVSSFECPGNLITCLQSICEIASELKCSTFNDKNCEMAKMQASLHKMLSDYFTNLAKVSFPGLTVDYTAPIIIMDDSERKELKVLTANLITDFPDSIDAFVYEIFQTSVAPIATKSILSNILPKFDMASAKKVHGVFRNVESALYFQSSLMNKWLVHDKLLDTMDAWASSIDLCHCVISVLIDCYDVPQLQQDYFSTTINKGIKACLGLIGTYLQWTYKFDRCNNLQTQLSAITIRGAKFEDFVQLSIANIIGVLLKFIVKTKKGTIRVLASKLLIQIAENTSYVTLNKSLDVDKICKFLEESKSWMNRLDTLPLICQVQFKFALTQCSVSSNTFDSEKFAGMFSLYLFRVFDAFKVMSEKLHKNELHEPPKPSDVEEYVVFATIITGITDDIRYQNNNFKASVQETFKPYAVIAIRNIEFPYMNNELLTHSLNIAVSFMLCFRSFMGEGCGAILASLITVSNRYASLGPANELLHTSLKTKILETLDTIVKENIDANQFAMVNNIFFNFVHSSYEIKDNIECYSALCKFVNTVLQTRWDYFVKSQSNQVRSWCHGYWSILIDHLLCQDCVIYECLTGLRKLNERSKVFSNPIFSENQLLLRLSYKMFQLLCDNSHANSHDEILGTFYSISRVDPTNFYRQLIPFLLSNKSGISDENRSSLYESFKLFEDQPSFVDQVHRMANDVSVYSEFNQKLNPF